MFKHKKHTYIAIDLLMNITVLLGLVNYLKCLGNNPFQSDPHISIFCCVLLTY